MEKGGRKENLKSWKKGQSGNPKGRPKMPDIKEALTKILNEEKDGRTALEAILLALRKKAITKSDVRAAQELLDRAYGKPKQNIDIPGIDKIGEIILTTVKKNDK